MKSDNNIRDLPQGWAWTELGRCVDILDGQRIPINAEEREKRIVGKLQSQLYPYYGATGQVGLIDNFLFEEELVLLGEDGAPFFDFGKNKAYIIKGKTWVNNHAHVLRAILGVTFNQFVCNYLNCFDYHGYVNGTTRAKLNQAPMRTIPVPLAPLPEQKRIVAKTEELFTRLDKGVEGLKKVKTELKRYRQAILKAAFEGKLTAQWRKNNKDKLEPANNLLERIAKEREKIAKGKQKKLPPLDASELSKLPDGWEWATMPQVGELNRGKSRHRPRDAPHLYGGKYPFVQTGDIRNAKGVIKEYTQTYSEEGLRQSRLWPKGTLCITIAANIADTAFLGFDACIPDSVVGFRTDERHCNTKYVEFFLRTAKADLERYAPATAQKNINLAILSVVAMPFPPLMEQTQIVSEIERYFSIADEVEQTIEKSLKESQRLRQSILKRAFEGKLVPQDPNDEPTEKLLERIKTEKTKLQINKKTTNKRF